MKLRAPQEKRRKVAHVFTRNRNSYNLSIHFPKHQQLPSDRAPTPSHPVYTKLPKHLRTQGWSRGGHCPAASFRFSELVIENNQKYRNTVVCLIPSTILTNKILSFLNTCKMKIKRANFSLTFRNACLVHLTAVSN